MPLLIKTVKIILALLLAYALYLLICSTLAYLPDHRAHAAKPDTSLLSWEY